MGAVTGTGDFVGGLVGRNEGTITQTYATGRVTGSGPYVGGLAGYSDNGSNATIEQSYWNQQTTTRMNSAGGNGLTTAQMQDITTFGTIYAGWDFVKVWSPPNQVGQNDGSANAYYPQLYRVGPVLPVTVENTLTSRIYGESIPGASFFAAGLSNGDYFSTQPLATGMPGVMANVGPYPITFRGAVASNPSGADYRIIYWPGAVEVTPRPVTVTADAQSRTYGDANPLLTYATSPLGAGVGLVNGDSLSGALTTSAGTTSGVGSYAITRGDLAASSNYTLTYVGNNLAVTPRPVTVTADAQSRTYGDANPSLTYTTSPLGAGVGLLLGDSLNGSLQTTAGTTSGVGSYAIERGTLGNSNYTLTYVGNNLAVTPRPVTVTADAQSRAYGDANPLLTYTTSPLGAGVGLVNGDSLSGALTTTADAKSWVGNHAITLGTLGHSNYTLTYVGNNLKVTPRLITVTADAQSRAYGEANPTLTYTTARNSGDDGQIGAPTGAGVGLMNGDSMSGAMKTAAGPTSGVGSYAITSGDLAASSNYVVTYVGNNLVVTPRLITLSADNQARDYGMANPALTYRITSGTLVNSDGIGGALTTNAAPLSEPGTYDISRGTLSMSSNYSVNFANGLLNIRPMPPEPVKTVTNSPKGSTGQCLQTWSTHGLDARQPQVPLPLCGVGFSYVELSPVGWTASLVE